MKIYKFGGASVKDADSVRNMASIIEQSPEDDRWVVVSAMDKTTNLLEILLEAYRQNFSNKEEILERVKDFHKEILDDLFPFSENEVNAVIGQLFFELEEALERGMEFSKDVHYDQVVSFGELLSTRIICAYLDQVGQANTWVDARTHIVTDDSHKEAKVDFQATRAKVQKEWKRVSESPSLIGHGLMVTQGFIGGNGERTTTLGREGSDYSGAILAWCLDAEELVIWKDVPGMLNADPKYFPDANQIPSISYKEAMELSYYGASVIHPKTLKPLQNKGIPLFVKSFVQPEAPGTSIHHDERQDGRMPSFIFKESQVLLSIIPKDFSFIMEEGLGNIFSSLAEHRLRANLTQNSAVSFSICLDDSSDRIDAFRDAISDEYKVLYNEGLSILTIRHYTDEVIDELLDGREVLVEQRSRYTARYVIRGGFSRPTEAD